MSEPFTNPAGPIAARHVTAEDNGPTWEYMVITCGPGESLQHVRRQVIDHAEYGRWELRRSLLYTGGTRKYWLRRRMMKVQRTL